MNHFDSDKYTYMNIKSYLWVIPFFSFLIGYGMVHYLFHIEYIETPLCIGKTIDQVLPLLTKHNLNMRLLTYQEDAHVPTGTIISQIPQAYQKIKPHQSIFFVIAKSQSTPLMPHLYGKKTEEIKKILLPNGLTSYRYSLPSNYPQSHCIAQIPLPGEPLSKKNIIFYVSDTNKQKIIWPNFIKKRVEDVKEFLSSYDIVPEILHSSMQTTNHTCTNCLIIDQRPLPGSIINFNLPEKILPVQLQVQ